MASKGKRTTGGRKSSEVRIWGNRLATLDKGLAMVRTGSKTAFVTQPADRTQAMLRKTAKALTKPGIKKAVIFQNRKPSANIFAYFADPSDAAKVMRESPDGTRSVGRLVGRKFKRA